MKKTLAVLLAVVVIALIGYLAMRPALVRRPSLAAAPDGVAPPASPSLAPAAASPASEPPPRGDAMNVAAPEFGGHIELVTSESDHEDRAAIHLIDRGLPEDSTWSAAGGAPQEIVIGFFEGQPARISAIVFNPNTHTAARWAKDVEIGRASCRERV